MWLELLSAGRKDYEHSRVIAFVSEGGVLGKSQSIAAHRRKVMEDMHGLYMCSCITGIFTPLLLHRLLHKQETTHFPETGFVDNGIEASDVLVCQCHMCSRGRSREVWCQLWGRWFPVSGWLPGFSWRARIVALFASELSSNTRTRHPRERREHRVVLPVLQHAWWFQTQANSKHTQLVRGSRPAQTGFSSLRWEQMTGPPCAYSIHWDSLLLPLSHLTMQECALMPPCVRKASYMTIGTW